MLRTSIEHNRRLNLIGAMCLSPGGHRLKLHVRSVWHALTGEDVLAFLKYLLPRVRGPILLLWDRHPIHKRAQVKAFLREHPRIEAHWFPVCAPELNPVEFVWTQTSEATASTAPRHAAELGCNVRRGVHRTRRSQKRLWACIYGSSLPWQRKPRH